MSASLNDRPNKVEVSGDAATVTAGAGVQGAQGEPGIIISATEPGETDVLWADTSAAGSMVVPAGGSTGQVLAKASASDYDSEWITPSSGGIPATIIDAKGDLIVGTAADTAARLAVGTNAQALVADSTQTSGLRWESRLPGATGLTIGGTVYVRPPGRGAAASAGTQAMNANWTYYVPIEISNAVTLDTLSISVNATGTATDVSLSVHSCDASLNPIALIRDAGTVNAASTGVKTTSGLAQLLPVGMYLLRFQSNGTWTALANLSYQGYATRGLGGSANPRLFVNNASSYSATAPNPGPTINAVVTGNTGIYDVVMGTFS